MNWLRAFGSALLATFRDEPRLWWLAPLIPLLAFLPELAQHMAEIKLDMFAGDPDRGPGLAKVVAGH